MIRLDESTLELTCLLDGSPYRESCPVKWIDGCLNMENGFMFYYFPDAEHLTLVMDNTLLRLTKAEVAL